MGTGIAEAQIHGLSDAEVDVLLEIYVVLRLTPGNGRILRQAGNMYVWHYKGISVTCVLVNPRREVAMLRGRSFSPLENQPRGQTIPELFISHAKSDCSSPCHSWTSSAARSIAFLLPPAMRPAVPS
jgi:hypothetical protein